MIRFPDDGALMTCGGLSHRAHRAHRTPPSSGWLPYCVPEWYAQDVDFHDSQYSNTYYCAFWSS